MGTIDQQSQEDDYRPVEHYVNTWYDPEKLQRDSGFNFNKRK